MKCRKIECGEKKKQKVISLTCMSLPDKVACTLIGMNIIQLLTLEVRQCNSQMPRTFYGSSFLRVLGGGIYLNLDEELISPENIYSCMHNKVYRW